MEKAHILLCTCCLDNIEPAFWSTSTVSKVHSTFIVHVALRVNDILSDLPLENSKLMWNILSTNYLTLFKTFIPISTSFCLSLTVSLLSWYLFMSLYNAYSHGKPMSSVFSSPLLQFLPTFSPFIISLGLFKKLRPKRKDVATESRELGGSQDSGRVFR